MDGLLTSLSSYQLPQQSALAAQVSDAEPEVASDLELEESGIATSIPSEVAFQVQWLQAVAPQAVPPSPPVEAVAVAVEADVAQTSPNSTSLTNAIETSPQVTNNILANVELFEVPVAQKTQPAAAPGQIASPNEVPIAHVPAEITQPANDQATLQFSNTVIEQPGGASASQMPGAADGATDGASEFAAHAEADTSQFDNSSTPGSASTPQRAELAEASTSLSSANATSQPLTTQVLTALAQRLSSVVGQTADSLTLRLDPPELGEVEVQFQRLDAGITIRVTAKESVTMEMLMSRGAEIEKLLRSQNPEVQRIELHHPDSPGEFGFGQGAGQFSRGHGGSPSRDLLADVDPLLTKPDEPLMHNGQRRMNITSGSRVRVRA